MRQLLLLFVNKKIKKKNKLTDNLVKLLDRKTGKLTNGRPNIKY